MDRTRGETEFHADNGGVSSHMHLRSGPTEEPGAGRAGGFRGVLGDLASRARSRAGDAVPPTSLLSSVEKHPMAALGLMFSAGFLLAISTGGRERPQFVSHARNRIRGLLLTGLTAAVAQELRSIVSEEDLSELFSAWTGHDEDEYEEYEL